jgi:hypothetical protein
MRPVPKVTSRYIRSAPNIGGRAESGDPRPTEAAGTCVRRGSLTPPKRATAGLSTSASAFDHEMDGTEPSGHRRAGQETCAQRRR